MILELIRNITNNFSGNTFKGSTLMGWVPRFDDQGRPLNADPNYLSGDIDIDGQTYYYIKKGWIVKLWDKPINYLQFDRHDYIEMLDSTPDYVKEYYQKKS